MHTQITARHFSAPQSLREYAAAKLAKLEKFYDGILDAHVILEHLRLSSHNTAEIKLTVYRQTLTAKVTAEKHTEAIDACIETLKRQLVRYKDKMRSHRKTKLTVTEDHVLDDAYDDE